MPIVYLPLFTLLEYYKTFTCPTCVLMLYSSLNKTPPILPCCCSSHPTMLLPFPSCKQFKLDKNGLLLTCWNASMPSSSMSTFTKNSSDEYCWEYLHELAKIVYSSKASLLQKLFVCFSLAAWTYTNRLRLHSCNPHNVILLCMARLLHNCSEDKNL